MSAYAKQPATEDEIESIHRLRQVTDPVILRYIADLRRQFGKYAVTPEETRREIDAAMGDQKLTDALYAMRHERP